LGRQKSDGKQTSSFAIFGRALACANCKCAWLCAMALVDSFYCPIVAHFVFNQVIDNLILKFQRVPSVAPLLPH